MGLNMALNMEETTQGLLIKVRAVPGASRERLMGLLGDALKVAVTAAPEKGKANKRLLLILARELHLPASRLFVFAGQTSRVKRILIQCWTAAQLQAQLRERLGDEDKD